MLIPHKYEDISQNMLSVGLDILKILKRRRNVYNLYKKLLEMRNDEYELSLNKFFLTLDFLYAVGIIDFDEESVVRLK
ncbi:MAG: ABC-three component system middle component 6 [Candidatus Methanofastidiosia archaeon]